MYQYENFHTFPMEKPFNFKPFKTQPSFACKHVIDNHSFLAFINHPTVGVSVCNYLFLDAYNQE